MKPIVVFVLSLACALAKILNPGSREPIEQRWPALVRSCRRVFAMRVYQHNAAGMLTRERENIFDRRGVGALPIRIGNENELRTLLN